MQMIDILFSELFLALFRQVLLAVVHSPDDNGHLEIERKFSLLSVSVPAVIQRLKEEHFYFAGSVKSTDWFIPTTVKGEMLRLRQEFGDGVDSFILTVKHWVQTSDNSREREERECKTKPLVFFLLLYLGKTLSGFRVHTFMKHRDIYLGELDGNNAVVAIDDATGLGDYSGPYLEIEVLAPRGSASKTVQNAIVRLAALIAPEASEVRHSYQEMLELSLR